MWKEYLLDVTDFPSVCFVPYERETENIVFGMNYIGSKCPGKLVGVIHSEGQKAVEKWCAKNLNWKNKYSNKGD